MAAPAHAITISRAAEILGEDEELLWELVTDMEPEDGCLWIYDTDDEQPSRSHPTRSNTCGRCSQSTSVTAPPRP